MTSLGQRLTVGTAELHTRLDRQPFFQALQAGTLPATSAVGLLRAFAIIHAVVERALTQTADTRLTTLARVPDKTPLLAADLERVGGPAVPSIAPAMEHALGCGAGILRDADNPLTLLGVLYVLEGSQGGAIVLRPAYARSLGVPEATLSYWGCYGSRTAAHWKAFTDGLDALECDEAEAGQIVAAAVRCFEGFDRICAALYPYDESSLTQHSAAINFEAGDHAVPQDPREVERALRAGRAAWERYPYLELRFGERGRRFTSSDSCWLYTLAGAPVERATKSLDWLRSVLASRGIPTVILETHLQCIARLCAEEAAGGVSAAAGFDRFLSGRRGEREALPGGTTLSELVERGERQLQACGGFTVPSAASLLASAWVDERAGVQGALASTRGWLTDPARFGPEWIAGVNTFLASLDALDATTGTSSC